MFFDSKQSWWILCAVLILGCGATSKCKSADSAASTAAAGGAQAASANPAKKYALLVGCTKYTNHDTWELQGPANDVKLLRQVLVDHFGFDDKHGDQYLVTLAEGGDENHRPTKANIQREFERLVNAVRADDQVVILLSGHGSQQPERESSDPADHKLDGQDEMFLPADTGSWNDAQQSVANVILDHELRRWLDRITDKGAHVWVIVDSCHSGTMLRGTDAEKVRQVSPDAMLVPREAIIQAKARAHERSASMPAATGTSGERPPMGIGGQMKNRVGLYAAQSSEPAPEMPLPDGEKDARPQGLLTYTLCQMITPKAGEPQPALTYRELGQRIRAHYAALGRTAPTPLVEGADLDREVLGLKQWPGRSRIVLTQDRDGQWQINAGKLIGLNQGSVLAVYDPQSDSDKPAGHVMVSEVGIASSTVAPCEYANVAKNQKLSPGSRCELKFVNFDSRSMTLAVDEVRPKDSKSNLAALDELRQAVKPLEEKDDSLIKIVDDAQNAAWRVQLDGKQCYLVPRCGVLQPESDSSITVPENPLYGPYDRDPKTLLPTLKDRLGRIARAQALISLTEQPAVELAQGQNAVHIDIKMLRFKSREDKTGEEVQPGAGIELHTSERIAFCMTNTGKRFKVYLTLLFIDSGYGITPIYPNDGEIVEALGPGESFTTGTLRVNAKTVGKEQVVAIAVKADGPPVDFSGLAQESLEQAREVNSVRGESQSSPLGKLLGQALYRDGKTRGLDGPEIEESALAHIVWRTRPEAK